MEQVLVIIVGAGPAGLATSACLNHFSISHIVLEREDCCASLWKKRAYDCMNLHIGKWFCQLPHMPFPFDAPRFIPRNEFITYLDNYASHFGINPRYCRSVESANYDQNAKAWIIEVKNTALDVSEVYAAQFLVLATGENSEGLIPDVPGLDSFEGEYMHSSQYESGNRFSGKDVLVVGCGNSGLEIAYDLSTWGAHTSIVARGPVHILSKDIVLLGMLLLKLLPCKLVDTIVTMLSNLKFGNISHYGFRRQNKGPFYLKETTGHSPTIDTGAMNKIRTGDIQIFPSVMSINGNKINFENGETKQFDAVIFATGYRSTVRNWLKGGEDLFNDSGMPKRSWPNHWKGENGLYCAGFSRNGLPGISVDARNIASDINLALSQS